MYTDQLAMITMFGHLGKLVLLQIIKGLQLTQMFISICITSLLPMDWTQRIDFTFGMKILM